MRTKMVVTGVILLTLVAVGIAYAATVVIDSFNDGEQNLLVLSTSPTAYSVVDTTGLLGGERDVVLQWTSGGRINLDVDLSGTANKLSYTGGDDAIGWASITWDGDDNSATTLANDGLDCVDLTGGGTNDAIVVRVINSDLRSRLTVQVYADTAVLNWSSSTIMLPPLNPGQRMDVVFPFSDFTIGGGTGATFDCVGAVVARLDGDIDASVDVSIDFVEASSAREYGDLPMDKYGTTMLSANHIPRGLRLGPNCDSETTHNSSTYADGDDTNQAAPDDEDGVVPTSMPWCSGADCGEVELTIKGAVNASGNRRIYVNGWIDWNKDGDFDDEVGGASERIVDFTRMGDATDYPTFDTPTTPLVGYYYARFRICASSTGCETPTITSVADGEVEDYRWYIGPTAVELASFTATPQAWTKTIRLDWETLTEVNNLGFNLYRAESPDGRQIKLNASLIPSQGPGSPSGYTYSFVDRAVKAGRTYYYWLEAVDVSGSTQLFDPVSAAIGPQLGAPKLSTP